MSEKLPFIITNNSTQVSRGTWNKENRTEDPDKPNHLFDTHKPFKRKDDVRQLNYLLSKLKNHYGSSDSGSWNNRPMRVTYHSGRSKKDRVYVYSTKHNDRNFDSESDHIVKEKTKDNITWNWCGDELTFEEGEQKFYEMVFSEQLNATNEGYIKSRHPDKVKTMKDWRESRLHAPEETIIQFGKMGHHPDAETSMACFKEFIT